MTPKTKNTVKAVLSLRLSSTFWMICDEVSAQSEREKDKSIKTKYLSIANPLIYYTILEDKRS